VGEHPRFLPVVEPVFSSVAAHDVAAVTSSITLLEVLVRPLQANLPALAAEYEQILTHSSGIKLIPLDLALLRRAAHLRASCGLKTPTRFSLLPPSNRAAVCSSRMTSGFPRCQAFAFCERRTTWSRGEIPRRRRSP
jgi:hypothetical protein